MLNANINRAGQRQRRVLGAIGIGMSIALLLALDQADAQRWWRILAFPLLWIGALGLLQAQARTCVVFAARGTCELEDGRHTALDAETAGALQARARRILVRSTLVALTVTLAILLLP